MYEIDKLINFENILKEFEKIKDLPQKYYILGQLNMLLMLTNEKNKVETTSVNLAV